MEPKLEINTRCINCDLCRVACPEDSILITDHQYVVETWSCTLCGLCVELCPSEAIQIQHSPLTRE